jgi:hypothetical protein
LLLPLTNTRRKLKKKKEGHPHALMDDSFFSFHLFRASFSSQSPFSKCIITLKYNARWKKYYQILLCVCVCVFCVSTTDNDM